MVESDYTGVLLDGRYRVRARLGQGGMGTVYVAEHVGLAQPRAIKFLREDLARKPGAVQRFLQEARVLSAMRHDNLVGVVDMGEHAGSAYYVMELLAGEDLRRRLRRLGGLGWPQTRAIALQVCAALRLTHARGVVHRDLKPENCFCVDAEGGAVHIKLIDFGVAKVPREAGGGSPLSGAGELLGTIGYMAPEQLEGHSDRRVDVYSLGALMFEMLAGRPLHTGNAYEILARMLLAPAPALASVCAVDPAIDRLIAAAVARDPDERFASMDAFAAAIAAIPATAEPQVFTRPAAALATLAGETTAGGTPAPADMSVTEPPVPADMLTLVTPVPADIYAPGAPAPADMPVTAEFGLADTLSSTPRGAHVPADSSAAPEPPADSPSASDAPAEPRAADRPVPASDSSAAPAHVRADSTLAARAADSPAPADSSIASGAPVSREPGAAGPPVPADSSPASGAPVSPAPRAADAVPTPVSPAPRTAVPPAPADSSPAPSRTRVVSGLAAALLAAAIAWQIWPADGASPHAARPTSAPATATGPVPETSSLAGEPAPQADPPPAPPAPEASPDARPVPPVSAPSPDSRPSSPVPAASRETPPDGPAAARPVKPRDAGKPSPARPLTREALRARLARELAACGSPYVAEEIAVRVTPGKDGKLAGLAAIADDRLAPGTVDCLERELARLLPALAAGVDVARAFDVSLTLPRRGGG